MQIVVVLLTRFKQRGVEEKSSPRIVSGFLGPTGLGTCVAHNEWTQKENKCELCVRVAGFGQQLFHATQKKHFSTIKNDHREIMQN